MGLVEVVRDKFRVLSRDFAQKENNWEMVSAELHGLQVGAFCCTFGSSYGGHGPWGEEGATFKRIKDYYTQHHSWKC